MMNKTLTIAVVLALYLVGSYAQDDDDSAVPDSSACEGCKETYTNWFISKRINATIWELSNDTKKVGDGLCSDAKTIHECFEECVIDPQGNKIPLIGDSSREALKSYYEQSCIEHECRLADTLMCSQGSSRSKCLSESMDCSKELLNKNNCDPRKLCHSAEKQAFITNVKDMLECYLTYPDFVVDGIDDSDERRRGLQLCQDVIVIGCLKEWHDETDRHDFLNFVNGGEDFRKDMCSEKKKKKAIECLSSVHNGTVSYVDEEWESPCNPELIKEVNYFVMESAINELTFALDYMCSDFYECDKQNETGSADEEGSAEGSGEDIDKEEFSASGEDKEEVSSSGEETEASSSGEEDSSGDVETTTSESDKTAEESGSGSGESTDMEDKEGSAEEKSEDGEKDVSAPGEVGEHDHGDHDHHDHGGPHRSPTDKSKSSAVVTKVSASLILLTLLLL